MTLRDGERLAFTSLFLFLGAAPCTEWLGDSVARDEKGFILTGPDAGSDALLETSVPGSTRRATCARDRSSAARRRSARARWSCFVHERIAA